MLNEETVVPREVYFCATLFMHIYTYIENNVVNKLKHFPQSPLEGLLNNLLRKVD